MEVENLEVREFLHKTLPLEALDETELNQLIETVDVGYRKRGYILTLKSEFIYLIRKGAVQIEDDNEKLYTLLGEKDWFGYDAQLSIFQHSCHEDTLYYRLNKKAFFDQLGDHPEVNNYFFSRQGMGRENLASDSSSHLLNQSVLEMTRANQPYLVESSTPIKKVAELMGDKQVTSVMVMKKNRLCGIVTDRAFCTKVVADGMDSKAPIEKIMSPNPITIGHYKSGVEAMLLMASKRIRHLPIVNKDKVVGVITAADLLRKQSHNVVFLINEIQCSTSVEQLIKISAQLPMLLLRDVEASMDEHDIAYSISSIGRAINQQLLKMAEALLGEPPIQYAWVVAGSLARSEQILHSDQDNLLILSDDYKAKEHDQYFKELSQFVSDGLNACGYVYCPGDVMATNPKWRQPLSVWKNYFDDWIKSPNTKALMHASIFFDMKCIYGDSAMFESLMSKVLKKAAKNSIFLSHMASNAQHYQPPLGFFRHFILEEHGPHEKALNMKKRGVVPVIDCARVYALSNQIPAVNTIDRLRLLADMGGLSESGAQNFLDAYKFINELRIRHQAQQIKREQKPDNYILPSEISSLDKKHLKDAFDVILKMQNAMGSQYQTAILP